MSSTAVATTQIKLAKALVIHARTTTIVLLLTCLGALLHANHETRRDCFSSLSTMTNESTKVPPQIALVAVVSMQRTASTWLAGQVIAGDGNPCAVSLNAIFSSRKSQSGNAWSIDGNNMLQEGPVQSIKPSLLVDFVVRVGQRKCAEKLLDDASNQCHNKCLVAFKEFDFHLSQDQHAWMWEHAPNMTVIVLERNVTDRYRSKWVASMWGDWDTKGSYWHAEKVAKEVPNIKPSKHYCNHHHDSEDLHGLCHFEEKHKAWYGFVRSTLPPGQRVEVSFNDTVLNKGMIARDKIQSALPRPFQELLTPMDAREVPEIALVAVASMRRSASTSLLKKVLVKNNPCAVSLGDVFVNNTDKSEDAWLIEGKDLVGSIDKLEPSLLQDFLVSVAQRKCTDKLLSDLDYQCRNKCIVGFKEFREHLSFHQHEYLWKNTPNLTVVVLERDLESRWKSRWIAAQTGDWDTTGSSQHKQIVKDIQVPPINVSESDKICKNKNYIWSHLCHFESYHNQWYKFLREQVPQGNRVEVSFNDTVLNDGTQAQQKIASGLPEKFRYLAFAAE